MQDDEALMARVRASFDKQSMMRTLGAELARVAPGEVEITAPILEGARQQQGLAHAGLTFAIGDSAAGYAALTCIADGFEVVTTEMKIHLLAPGLGARLVARGRVIKPGRRLVIAQADVFALDGSEERHIALLMGSMMPVKLA